MQTKTNGWVIINKNHPRTKKEFIVSYTFSSTRRDAIQKFCEGSGQTWFFWRTKYNFSASKAIQSVVTPA